MKQALDDLLGMLRTETLKPLALTARCEGKPADILGILPFALCGCGGWLLRSSQTPDGAVRAFFEIERSAALEMFVALAELGLVLSPESELFLTQTCQCTRYLPFLQRIGVATVELLIESRATPRAAAA